MEAIQNATQADYDIFPAILLGFYTWMTSQGGKEGTARAYTKSIGNLVDQDGKSAAGMASDEYYQLVRASERNKRCNQALQCAVRRFIEFWQTRPDEPWPDPGPTPRFQPLTRQASAGQEKAGQPEAPPKPRSPPRRPADAPAGGAPVGKAAEENHAAASPKPRSPSRKLADASVADLPAKGAAKDNGVPSPKPKAAKERAEGDAAKPCSGDSSQLSRPAVSEAESKEVDSGGAPVKRGLSLEEDAPKSSAAWTAIKPNNHKTPYFSFTFKEASGRKVPFQVTVRMAGDKETAARICRLCYFRFEEGALKEEVTAYRNDLFQSVGRVAGPREAAGGGGEAGEGKQPSKAAEKPQGAEGAGKRKKVKDAKDAGSSAGKKHKADAKPDAAANGGGARAGARSSSSSSSSSSSDSSDESKAEAAAAAAAARQRACAAEGPEKPRGLVATKLSVRTGLRCSCHFSTSCPSRSS